MTVDNEEQELRNEEVKEDDPDLFAGRQTRTV
jgi:hypothetical protein